MRVAQSAAAEFCSAHVSRVEREEDLTDVLHCVNSSIQRALATLMHTRMAASMSSSTPHPYNYHIQPLKFVPPLPSDMRVSFHIQGHRLVLTVTREHDASGKVSDEVASFAAPIVFLTDIQHLLASASQICQHQIHDKVSTTASLS